MTLHIVVNEDYSPDVFNGVAAVAKRYGHYFLDEENTRPVTTQSLRKELKEFGSAKLFAQDAQEWEYKVFVR